jgi:hypothetical protein
MRKKAPGINERLAAPEKPVSDLAHAMTLEERLVAMEQRLEALEAENRELRAGARDSGLGKPQSPVTRDPDAIRAKIDADLTPMQQMKMRELARDVIRYGYDAAMATHGRPVYSRGKRKAS